MKKRKSAYEERENKRPGEVLSYISSENFAPRLARSVDTCNPRRTFARNINPRSTDPKNTRIGVSNSLSTILKDYRGIFSCVDIFANYVVGKLGDSDFHRLYVSAAIFRSLLYQAERNIPSASDLRRALRGETQCEDFARTRGNSSCCMDSGCAYKFSQVLAPIPNGTPERMMGETMLTFCLERLSKEIRRSGCVGSTIIERLFSITRALGLRRGYRLER